MKILECNKLKGGLKMRGYVKGMVLGGLMGAAASMLLLNYYEPRSARSLMRKGHGAMRFAARKIRHYTGI